MRTQLSLASICLAFSLTAASSSAAVLFLENFETGLGKWTGKQGGAHHGLTVPDPLASGRGAVLTFSHRTTAGDIFSTSVLSAADSILISFDYLGLATEQSVAGDLGGTNFFRGDGAAFCTRDPVPVGQPQRFYRVVLTNALPTL